MKKALLLLSIVALVSCGGSATTEEVKDSTDVDSIVIDNPVIIDSAAKVDTAAAK